MTVTIVVLAAGTGSRFGGPKQLVPVGPGGESILDYNIHDAVQAGFDRVVVVTRAELQSQVHDVLDRSAGSADAIVRLQEIPLGRSKPYGTAHAVLTAAGDLDRAFAVANADDLYGPGSFESLRQHLDDDPQDAAVVGFSLDDTVPPSGRVSRAVLAHDGDHVRRIVEVHDLQRDGAGWAPAEVAGVGALSATTLVSMNLWGLPTRIVPDLSAAVDGFVAAGAQGEIYLPEVVGDALTQGRLTVALLHTDERWAGMTNPKDLEVVRRHVRARPLL